ncbi:protein MAIN-LIKE 1-like [Lotus japonicus]|uniref:protein MAIN-LIKE 1-like n=1 Tax=Lotus japonicus TaxID=34305 RepID=UPI002583EC91|nr:protein MAIN-LIKE 1-like [Lotus japonicus]
MWHALLGTTDHRYVDRGHLRLATAGTKLGLMTCVGDEYREVRLIVERSGLYPLARCSYAETDLELISALVERWHEETSSFHMPFREMNVTLDDVSALLHIPFEGRYEHAARMYLMHLVGATLFADKSGGHSFSARWIGMLQNLEGVSEFVWGAMALATLYDQLGQSSRRGVKQMDGYTSLLLAWIFEHFPDRLVRDMRTRLTQRTNPELVGGRSHGRGHARLAERRVLLDELTTDDVIWTPYEAHREWRQRDERALFSGYIRCPYPPDVRPHLPERVMPQFGYIQMIPRHPSEMDRSPVAEVVDVAFTDYVQYLFPEGVPAIEEGESVGGYMDCFELKSFEFMSVDCTLGVLFAELKERMVNYHD